MDSMLKSTCLSLYSGDRVDGKVVEEGDDGWL